MTEITNTIIDAPQLDRRLELAVDVAREAGALILCYYQSDGLSVELKGDDTPVTAADRGAEQLIRERLLAAFPDDGVLGEEFGEQTGTSGCRWILDPLDGTKSFVHGVPLFGTLIGLEHQGRMVLGVCRFPALDEVVYAAAGRGAWRQVGENEPQAARVSTVESLDEALFCTTTITGWSAAGRQAAFESLCRTCRLTRGWGDCYGHMLVATGRADVMIDPALNTWDAAALLPILEEAGGHFLDLDGRPTIYSSNGLSVNRHLKDAVLAALQGQES